MYSNFILSFFLQAAAHENIKIRPSKSNRAAGDCIFESTADQCLVQYRGRPFPGFTILNHQQLRELTVETLGANEEARAFGLVDSDLEWEIELGKLLEREQALEGSRAFHIQSSNCLQQS